MNISKINLFVGITLITLSIIGFYKFPDVQTAIITTLIVGIWNIKSYKKGE